MSKVNVLPVKSFSLNISEIAPDKSISHRSVMFSMLASGTSTIENFLRAEDTLNSLEIVKNLGAKVEDDGKIITISSDGIQESFEVLDCGNSGTGMRLFCGLLSSANGHFILTGDKYLRNRPMKRVTTPLINIGAKLDGRLEGDLAPLSIRGSSLKAFNYESEIASAQVKSCMILAALRADGVCTYTEPELSRDHTERMLKGMRLFCGLLSSANGHFILTGDKYLRNRPMKRVTTPLINIGAKLDGRLEGDLAPLSIRGSSLKAFNYESEIASAQVKSCMILAALRADGVCTYTEPELSRDHTERMLKGMGADIKVENLKTTVTPMKELLSPLSIRVPADPSSAFFFAVAAAITPDSEIVLEGVTLNPTRIEAFKALERMGTNITYTITDNKYEPIGDISVKYAPLKAITVEDNISWLIDELPALSIAMACASGESVVKNAEELRVKESDRISTVVEGLRASNIEVHEYKDGYKIVGGELSKATVDSDGDHRIAMSFIIAGLKSGMEVTDLDCINTSFPNFFELLQKITTIDLK